MLKKLLPVALILALIATLIFWQREGEPAAESASTNFIAALTSSEVEGFSLATEPGAIQFPRDFGAHPDYQTEWWYYTGNLETAEGRPFGFQLTFFRIALAPTEAMRETFATSDWATNQVYFAHFTISDVAEENFLEAEVFSRGAVGLAGAQATPYRVWINEWQAQETADGLVRLTASTEEAALDLTLTQTLPPILHGDAGLSQKGEAAGNASHYYSLVQQEAEDTVTVGDEPFTVTGKAWKDHEYSTSALEADAIGWDWFSLQFDNEAALMLFEIRLEDGSIEPWSSGTYVAPDGTVRPLRYGDWEITINDTWTSPQSGGEYPAGWRIRVPEVGIDISGEPLMADQELNVSTTYWEGAVEFSGALQGEPASAQGYIELTGYTAPAN